MGKATLEQMILGCMGKVAKFSLEHASKLYDLDFSESLFWFLWVIDKLLPGMIIGDKYFPLKLLSVTVFATATESRQGQWLSPTRALSLSG